MFSGVVSNVKFVCKLWVCVHTCLYTCTIDVHIHVCTYSYKCHKHTKSARPGSLHIYIHKRTQTHLYIHTYIHIYLNIYVYMYVHFMYTECQRKRSGRTEWPHGWGGGGGGGWPPVGPLDDSLTSGTDIKVWCGLYRSPAYMVQRCLYSAYCAGLTYIIWCSHFCTVCIV